MEPSQIMSSLAKLIDEWEGYEADAEDTNGYEFAEGKEYGLKIASMELKKWIKDNLGFTV